MNYLDKLKEKCNLDDNFMNIVSQIFEKLLSFGYITKRQEKALQKKLYSNIDVVIFGNEAIMDYKTGYYDAIKKELYIKDVNNIEAIYLRILYALTTTEISRDIYSTGYSVAAISKANYKIIYNDFGINRAVISNLACRLLYTLPTSLELIPTYRTYENDFLGNKISSDNDIYFLEGKILSQICYLLNESEESLYINLFLNPRKYLKKFFIKNKCKNYTDFLNLLDETSRKYSNYNKLVFFNKILDDNYLNIKRNILDKSKKDKFIKEQEKIKMAIRKALIPFIPDDENDEYEFEQVETSLSEKINEFEEVIKSNIIKLQEMLVSFLMDNELKYSNVEYAIKLKKLNSLLIIPSEKITEKIYEIIAHKILNSFENTSTNLIEKIKYSLVNEILESEKYVKIYKDMQFKKLDGITSLDETSAVVAITIDNDFMQLVKVDDLNKNIKELENNTETLKFDSLGYLLNSPSATSSDISYIERVFTKIKNKFNEFTSVRVENMFICKVSNTKLIIIPQANNFSVIEIVEKNKEISLKLLKKSESYSIFTSSTNTNMPILYNKKEGTLARLMSLLAFFS